jgi:hypothetical protein
MPQIYFNLLYSIYKEHNIDDSWNPHVRLEFLKIAICSVFSSKVSERQKSVNKKIKETKEELNQMENLKI